MRTYRLAGSWGMVGVLFAVLFAPVAVRAQGFKLPSLESGGEMTASTTAPKVKVELLADQTAVVPGGKLQLALHFTVPSGWHIYWKNGGEGGLDTKVEWTLPPGWTVGPLQFPAPERYIDEADAHTFILQGEPTLLVTLTAPADAKPGETETIAADASWLVCQKLCFPGKKSLVIDVPVVASADQVKPANEQTFELARQRLPVLPDKAKGVRAVHAVASVDKAKAGAGFSVAVVFEVDTGHHINSHKPLEEGLISTDVFAERVEGAQVDRPVFPAGEVEDYHGEKLSVYRGKAAVILPVHVDGDLDKKQLEFAGVLTYQACSDETGTCDPPTAVDWSLALPVAGKDEPVAAANADVFADVKPQTAQAAGQGFSLSSKIRATTVQEHHSLAVWLGLALLAGLILNITPCVLPVISIKVLSFVQQASQSPGRVFRLGLAFSLGMMLVFNALAIMATSLGLVWGQHFQSPAFTIAMAGIVFAFGLSMFGVFTLGVPQSVGEMAVRAEGEGYMASVAKGALATVMGTPCLGPFLGPVLVWATAQPAVIVFLVFNTIGVGMALPYVLLTANPRWLRFVPKAGPWLTTFKQAMAFLLMGTVVYLLYILEGQQGGSAVIRVLVLLTAVGLACWLIGRFVTYNTTIGGRLNWYAVAVLIVAGTGYASFRQAAPVELKWEPFSLERLTQLTAEGKPVFLDITARWCPNCQLNTKAVFDSAEFAAAVHKYRAVPMLADWTARGPEIGELIEKLAPGASIPLAAVFPAGRPDEPTVMLGIVTRQQVIDNLAKAAE